MVPSDSQDRLIRRLARDLEPVGGLVSPGQQVLLWFGCLVAIAMPLALTREPTTIAQRLGAAPDICLGAVSSMLTALLGAAAAFMLSRPDRPRIWALLPAPAAALWIVTGAIGCLKQQGVADIDGGAPESTEACFFFILGIAMPVSMLLVVLLRRGYSLWPDFTSMLCGLASAGAAATITNVVHPHEAGAAHLALHGLAIGVIVVSNKVVGHWVLDTTRGFVRRNKGPCARE
jgi:hypothetical protein